MSTKKGQIEMMGLVVIVILVAIGLYIVVSIVLSPKVVDVPLEENQLAQNFVNALVKTDTSCGYSMREIIQDCKLNQKLNCSGISSCEYSNQTIGYILNNTLNVWGYSYNFSSPQMQIEYINKNCTSNKQRGTQGFAYISLYGMGDVLFTLDICKG
jgi:hypothetical protein